MVARRGARIDAGQAALVGAIDDTLFARYQRLVHEEAGIFLGPTKRALLAGRLARRLRECGVASYAAYLERAERDPAERVRLLDLVSTNETHFFREPNHFAFLEGTLLPALRAEGEAGRRPRRLRIWSAGCSTGEEPYSIAMALLAALRGWDLEVLATDLSTRVLARAESAVWPLDKSDEIPPAHRKAFMMRGVGRQLGLMKAAPELRALVRVTRLNLVAPLWPPDHGPFDAVFCRNVLIYFDRPTKERVVSRLVERLAPGGHLFLGHAESLNGLETPRMRAVQPTIYVRAGAPGGGER